MKELSSLFVQSHPDLLPYALTHHFKSHNKGGLGLEIFQRIT